MTRKTSIIVIGVTIAILAIVMIGWRMLNHPEPTPLDTATYLKTLADEGTAALATDQDKSSVTVRVRAPLFGAEQIGTLVMPNNAIGISRGCLISVEPRVQIPNGFPPQSYHLTKVAAVNVSQGLMHDIVAKLNMGANRTIEMGFENVKAFLLYDDDVQAIAQSPQCQQIFAGRPLWIVRGYIQAQRKLTITGGITDRAAIGEGDNQYKVDAGSDANSVSISDKDPVPLFEIISEVTVAKGGGKATLSQPADTPQATVGAVLVGEETKLLNQAPATTGTGLVYFQMDAKDTSGNAAHLQDVVRGYGVKVEPLVQKMKTGLPKKASVRYFNDADRGKAAQILAAVKSIYPDAELKPFRLAAPRGQMEVWLPRIS